MARKLDLTRARKKIARCVKKFGEDGDKQQMEVYDHARFWTITGDVWAGNREIGDGQAAVDWLCDEYLSGGAEEKVGTVKHEAVTYRAPSPGLSSLIDRANGYVSECKPVAKGGLRNAAFSISGHLHAMTDELNQRLTDQEVEYLLRDWNAKNVDKLRNEELAEASRNGRTNGTPRANKAPKEKIRLPEVRLPKIPAPGTAAAVTPHVAINRSVTGVEAGTNGTTGTEIGTTDTKRQKTGEIVSEAIAPVATGTEIGTTTGQVSGHSVKIPEKPPEVANDPDIERTSSRSSSPSRKRPQSVPKASRPSRPSKPEFRQRTSNRPAI